MQFVDRSIIMMAGWLVVMMNNLMQVCTTCSQCLLLVQSYFQLNSTRHAEMLFLCLNLTHSLHLVWWVSMAF